MALPVYLKRNSVKEKDAKETGEKLQILPYTQGAILLSKENGQYERSLYSNAISGLATN